MGRNERANENKPGFASHCTRAASLGRGGGATALVAVEYRNRNLDSEDQCCIIRIVEVA